MKVLLISKAGGGGGAALAAYRLLLALRDRGVEANMLVREGTDEAAGIVSTTANVFKRLINFLRFVWERLVFLPFEKSPGIRFHFSLANTGEDVTRDPGFKEADIIHLHWINGGFLSLRSLRKILGSGKPVVWTFHDEWAYTGGCHLALDCHAFTAMCGMCPYLRRPGKHDLSNRIWNRKNRVFRDREFHVVAPGKWLSERVRSSSLLGKFNIHVIPNLTDAALFSPVDRTEASGRLGLEPEKRYILFGAASMTSYFKGFDYFQEAVNLVHQKLGNESGIEILLFGKSAGDVEKTFPFKTRNMGRINRMEEMADLYSMAAVYVNPSLQESFGYTVLESMLCGTPVVGFRTGAIAEIIDHQENGYLADYRSAEDLARGILWSLHASDPEALSERARSSVMDRFRDKESAEAHMALYQQILEENGKHA